MQKLLLKIGLLCILITAGSSFAGKQCLFISKAHALPQTRSSLLKKQRLSSKPKRSLNNKRLLLALPKASLKGSLLFEKESLRLHLAPELRLPGRTELLVAQTRVFQDNLTLDPSLVPKKNKAPKEKSSKKASNKSQKQEKAPSKLPDNWPTKAPSAKGSWSSDWEKVKSTKSSQEIKQMLEQGHELFREKKYEQAITSYKTVLKEKPNKLTALLMIARAYTKQKKYEQAKKTYQEAMHYHPGEKLLYRELGDLSLKMKQPKKASTWYQLYLRSNPQDKRVWASLSRSARESKQPELEDYSRAQFNRLGGRKASSGSKGSKAPVEGYRFYLTLGANHHFFHQGAIWQNLRLEFGARVVNKLWLFAGVEGRLRYLNSGNFGDLFTYAGVVWNSSKWRGLYTYLKLGGSPLQNFAPQFYAEFDAGIPFGILQFHPGYRYYLFANRQAHLLAPGLSLNLARLSLHLRYFLNISQLSTELPWRLRHFLLGTARWLVHPKVAIILSVGGGNALDYLLEVYKPPTSGPFAGSDPVSEFIVTARIGTQIQLAENQFLYVNYTYYHEEVTPYPGADPTRAQAHILGLGYRLLF